MLPVRVDLSTVDEVRKNASYRVAVKAKNLRR